MIEDKQQEAIMLCIGNALLRKRIFGDIYRFRPSSPDGAEFIVDNEKINKLVQEISAVIPEGVNLVGEIRGIIKQIIMEHIDERVATVF